MNGNKPPKIILWDLETSFSLCATFSLWPTSIPFENIIQEWVILSAAWKELGNSKVHNLVISPDNIQDDKPLIKALHKVLSSADMLIAHNGDKFDLKKFNTRCIYHGLDPLPPVKTYDTLKVAKKHFKFTSNRLDYIAQYLNVDRKQPTSKNLWLKVLQGDPKAIKEMVKYNKQDVVVLEQVYNKLVPYSDSGLNRNLFDGVGFACRSCGSNNLTRQGYRYTRVGKYQQYKCKNCGAWSQDKKNLALNVEVR